MLKKLPDRIALRASLGEILEKRRTNRCCQTEELADDVLATLLWACAGITTEDGKRTCREYRIIHRIP